MSTRPKETEIESLARAEGLAKLQAAVDRAIRGVRDPEAMRLAGESMDRTREELRRRFGVMEVAVSLIREGRDEE